MMSEVKIGAVISYIAIAIRIMTQILLTPHIIGALGVGEYGLFLLSNSLILWFSLSDLGLGAAVGKFVVSYRANSKHENIYHFVGQSVMIFSVLGILTGIIGAVSFFFLDSIFTSLSTNEIKVLKPLYLLTVANVVISFPLRPFSYLPNAYQKYIIPSCVGLLASLLNTILTISLLYLDFKAFGLTLTVVLVGILQLIWQTYYSIKVLGIKIIFKSPDTALYRELFAFSVWVFIAQIIDILYWRIGSVILAKFSGSTAVSIYTLSTSFSQYFITLSLVLSGVLSARIMHIVATGASAKHLTDVMVKLGRVQLSVLVIALCLFYIYGRSFLQLWIGESLSSEIELIWRCALIVLIPLMVPLTQTAALPIIQAKNAHNGRSCILIISSVVSAASGTLLSLKHGPLGMCLGISFSLVFGQILMLNIYYSKKIGLSIGHFFKTTYLPMLLPVSLIILAGLTIRCHFMIISWLDFFTNCASFITLSIIILYMLYFNNEEKAMFTIPIKKYISKT